MALYIYLSQGKYGGQDPEFWDSFFIKQTIPDLVKGTQRHQTTPIFLRYLPHDGKILEGGCGYGTCLIFYRNLGYDVEGVDWSQKCIETIKAYDSTLPVRIGNVLSLPYKDGYFKAYISLGVAEHFQEGPQQMLREANRVLMKGGLLIISVNLETNIISRIENFILFGHTRLGQIVTRYPKENLPFIEYQYTRAEMEAFLAEAGFEIIDFYKLSGYPALARTLTFRLLTFLPRRLKKMRGKLTYTDLDNQTPFKQWLNKVLSPIIPGALLFIAKKKD